MSNVVWSGKISKLFPSESNQDPSLWYCLCDRYIIMWRGRRACLRRYTSNVSERAVSCENFLPNTVFFRRTERAARPHTFRWHRQQRLLCTWRCQPVLPVPSTVRYTRISTTSSRILNASLDLKTGLTPRFRAACTAPFYREHV